MANKWTKITGETTQAYLFNLPLVLIAFAFIALPVLGTLYTSLFRDITFMPDSYIGVDNYERILEDGHFWNSLLFTIQFVIVSVILELGIGFIFALVLNETLPARGLFRTVILIPWAIPIAISARVWELIYNYDYGLLNYIIIQTGLTNEPVSWVGTSTFAFFAVVLADVWKTTPFITIILLSGLSTISNDLYKQAKIDGSGILQRFWYVTIPMLKPALVVALLFRTIDAIRIFDLLYVLTGGGPGGSTTSLSLYAFKYYVTGNFGYGAAVSIIVFVLAAGLGALYIHLGQFRENIG